MDIETLRARESFHLGIGGTDEADVHARPLETGREMERGRDGSGAATLMQDLEDAERHRHGRWSGSKIDW